MTVGIDFGTTNSIISYWDEHRKLDEHRQHIHIFFFHENEKHISSLIYYNKREEKSVGEDGFVLWDGDDENNRGELCNFFKTFLALEPTEWEKNGWKSKKTPIEVAKNYLKEVLFDNPKSFENIQGKKITNLVVSVPQLWQSKNAYNKGIYNLREIFKEIAPNLSVDFISEPVAAAAYYAWRYHHKSEKLLVCDMGGGTLDVCYCKIESAQNSDTKNKIKSIEIIAYEGNDNDKAGNYNLRQILRNAYKRENQQVDETSPLFIKRLRSLEKQLIGRGSHIKDTFNKYPDYDYDEKKFFTVEGLPILASDMHFAFEDIKKAIIEILDKIKKQNNISFDFNQLLLVGGFNQYFLVRKVILDCLDLQENDSKISNISKNEVSEAISFGATILAAQKVKIIEYYPHSISFYTYKDNGSVDTKKILPSKTLLEQTDNWGKAEGINNLEYNDKNNIVLKGYVALNDNANDKIEFLKDIQLPKNTVADLTVGDKKYLLNNKIGFRIDKSNQIFFFVEHPKYKKLIDKPLINLTEYKRNIAKLDEAREYVNQIKISESFKLIEEITPFPEELKIPLNDLRMRYIEGDHSYAFFEQLKTFIDSVKSHL